MKVPEHPTHMKNETITVNGTTYPILLFEVVPGKYTDTSMTKFNWTFVDFTPRELLVQIDFENPNYISSNKGDPDSIKLIIYGV